jgi:hypothetical protein
VSEDGALAQELKQSDENGLVNASKKEQSDEE